MLLLFEADFNHLLPLLQHAILQYLLLALLGLLARDWFIGAALRAALEMLLVVRAAVNGFCYRVQLLQLLVILLAAQPVLLLVTHCALVRDDAPAVIFECVVQSSLSFILLVC